MITFSIQYYFNVRST